MGRHADFRFSISSSKLHGNRAERFWEDCKNYGLGYHLIANNCCDVVLKALEKGGAFDWVHPGVKVISTPRFMSKYCKTLSDATEKEGALSRLKIRSFHPFW